MEEVETAKDSRLAREFVVALPIELNREEQIALLQEFIGSSLYQTECALMPPFMTPTVTILMPIFC